MVLKFKVTNENIKLRFQAEKRPGYGIKQFCEQFGIIRNLAYKWMSTEHSRMPNATNKCPRCGKTKSDLVYDWINDGTLIKKTNKKVKK